MWEKNTYMIKPNLIGNQATNMSRKIQKQRLYMEVTHFQVKKTHLSNTKELRTLAGLW